MWTYSLSLKSLCSTPPDSVQRFPDNLKLPLNAAPEQFILLIIVKRFVLDKPENSRSSFSDIIEVREDFILHRRSPSP